MAVHRNLPDSELHEPKGVAGATSGTVYIANGGGSGTWTLPQANRTTVSNPRLTGLGPTLEDVLLNLLNRIEALEAASTP